MPIKHNLNKCNLHDKILLTKWLETNEPDHFALIRLVMARVKLFSVKKIALKNAGFSHVKIPETGFQVVLSVDKAQEALMRDPKRKKALEAEAKGIYKKFLLQTSKQLQKYEKLFAGMITKGAAADVVGKQAEALKLALEKETPKWERAAAQSVKNHLGKIADKKR